jgi:DHA2 family multidrug resistance protein
MELAATAEALEQEEQRWRPSVNPWLIAMSVIVPTFMEVLDTTIANVALNHIAGSMSATYSEATWVLTSYLIANAVVLPLTAWLGNRFGRKRFLLGCIFLFTASSLLCGLSINLPTLLFMRVLQGLGGGGLAPVSQAILMESFPPKKQGTAMALFGLGVVVAPVIGPILGGWLTDSYSWRWVFYINFPIGLIALWAVQQTVEDPPWVRNSDPGPLDTFGFLALATWLGCQEVCLDKGQENDWFSSGFIEVMAVLAAIGFVAFVIRELRVEKPMVDLRIFRARNFTIGTTLMFLVGFVLYAVSLATPQFLQVLMGYSSLASGIATTPVGVGSMISMIVIGSLASKCELRALAFTGFLVFALSAYQLSRVSLTISPWTIFWPQIIFGLSLGFLFIPVNVAGTATLRRDEMGSATGILNLFRNVGGSVGIASVSTYLARSSQAHQNMMVKNITTGNHLFLQHIGWMQAYMSVRMPASGNGLGPALGVMYSVVQQQTHLLAFRDLYKVLALIGVISGLLVVFMNKAKAESDHPVIHH